MTPWLAYAGASALNVALFVFLSKWRRRALLAETELAAREVTTYGAFKDDERVTK